MKMRKGKPLKTAILVAALKVQPMRYTDMQRFLYSLAEPQDLQMSGFHRGYFCVVLQYMRKNILKKRSDGFYEIRESATENQLQNPTAFPWARKGRYRRF